MAECIEQSDNGVMFSVVGDIPVIDNGAHVVISSISRIAGSVFKDAHRGKICVCVFIDVSVRAL